MVIILPNNQKVSFEKNSSNIYLIKGLVYVIIMTTKIEFVYNI